MIRLFIVLLSAMSMLIQSVYASTYGFWQDFEVKVDSLADFSANSTYNLFSDSENTFFGQTNLRYDEEEFVASQGFGYRYLNNSKTFMLGMNTVYDWKVLDNNHYQRLSFGLEFRFPYVSLTSNYYLPLTKEKNRMILGKSYATGVYGGYDVELTGNIPLWKGNFLNRLDITGGFYSWDANTNSLAGAGSVDGYESFKSQKGFTLGANLYVVYGLELFAKHYFKKSEGSAINDKSEDETVFGLKYVYNFDSKSRAIMNTNPANLEQYRFKKVTRDYDVKLYARENVITKNSPTLRLTVDEYPNVSKVLLLSDEISGVDFSLGDEKLDKINRCELYLDNQLLEDLTVVNGDRCINSSVVVSNVFGNSRSIAKGISSFNLWAVATGEKGGLPAKVTSNPIDTVIVNVNSLDVVSSAPFLDGFPAEVTLTVPQISKSGYNYLGCDVVKNGQFIKAKLTENTDINGNPVALCKYDFIPDSNKASIGFKLYSDIGNIEILKDSGVEITGIAKNQVVVPLPKVFVSEPQNIFAVLSPSTTKKGGTRARRSTSDLSEGNVCTLEIDGATVDTADFSQEGDLSYCSKNGFVIGSYVDAGNYTVGLSYNRQQVGKSVNIDAISEPVGSVIVDGNYILNDGVITPSNAVVGFGTNFVVLPVSNGARGIDNSVSFKSCKVKIGGGSQIAGKVNSVGGKCEFTYKPNIEGKLDVEVIYSVDATSKHLIYNTFIDVEKAPLVGEVLLEYPDMYLSSKQNISVNIENPSLYITGSNNISCRLYDTEKMTSLSWINAIAGNVTSCKFTNFEPSSLGFMTTGTVKIAAEVKFTDVNGGVNILQSKSIDLTLNKDTDIVGVLELPDNIFDNLLNNASGTLPRTITGLKSCYVMVNGSFMPSEGDSSVPRLGNLEDGPNGEKTVCKAQFVPVSGVNIISIRWENASGYIFTNEQSKTSKSSVKINFENLERVVFNNKEQQLVASIKSVGRTTLTKCEIWVNDVVIPSNLSNEDGLAKCSSDSKSVSFANSSDIVVSFTTSTGIIITNKSEPQKIKVVTAPVNYNVRTKHFLKDADNKIVAKVEPIAGVVFNNCEFYYSDSEKINADIKNGVECSLLFNPKYDVGTKLNTKVRFLSNNSGYADSEKVDVNIINKPDVIISDEEAIFSPVFSDRKQTIVANLADLDPSMSVVSRGCRLFNNEIEVKSVNSVAGKCQFIDISFAVAKENSLTVRVLLNNGTELSSLPFVIKSIDKPEVIFNAPSGLVNGVSTKLTSKIAEVSGGAIFNSCMIKINNNSFKSATFDEKSQTCSYDIRPTIAIGASETITFKFTSIVSGQVDSSVKKIPVISKPILTLNASSLYVFEDKPQNMSASLTVLDGGITLSSCKLKEGSSELSFEGEITGSNCNFSDVTLKAGSHNLFAELVTNGGVVVSSNEVLVVSYAKPKVQTTLVKPKVMIKGMSSEIEISTPSFEGITYEECEIKVNETVVLGSKVYNNSCKVNYTSDKSRSSDKLSVKANFVSGKSGEIGKDNELQIDIVNVPTISLDNIQSPIFNNKRDIMATLNVIDANLTATKCELFTGSEFVSAGALTSSNCKFSDITLKPGIYSLIAKLYLSDIDAHEVAIIESVATQVNVQVAPAVVFNPPSTLTVEKSTELQASVSVESGVVVDSCSIKINSANYVKATLSGTNPNYVCKYSVVPSVQAGSTESFKFKFTSAISGETESAEQEIRVVILSVVEIDTFFTPVFIDRVQDIVANISKIDPSLSVVSNGCKLYNDNTVIKSVSFTDGKCQFTGISFVNVKDYSLVVKLLLNNSSELSSSPFVIRAINKPSVTFEPPVSLVKGVTTNLTSNVAKVSGGATFNNCMIKINSFNYVPANFNESNVSCSYDMTPTLEIGDDEVVVFKFVSTKSGQVESAEKRIRIVSKPVVKLTVNSPYVFEDKMQDISAVVTGLNSRAVADDKMSLLSCVLKDVKGVISLKGTVKGDLCNFNSVRLDENSYKLFSEVTLTGGVVISSNEVSVVSYAKPKVPTTLIKPKVIVKGEATEIEVSTPNIDGITYNSCVVKANNVIVSGSKISNNSCKVTYTSVGSSGKLLVKAKFISDASGEVGDNELQIDMVDKPTIVLDNIPSPIFNDIRDLSATLAAVDSKITVTKCELFTGSSSISIGTLSSGKCEFNGVNLRPGSYNLVAKIYLADDSSHEVATIESPIKSVVVQVKPSVTFNPPATLITGESTEIQSSVVVESGIVINSCAIKIDTANYINATLSGSAPNYVCKHIRIPIASVGSTESFKFKFISTISGEVESEQEEIRVSVLSLVEIASFFTPVFVDRKQTIVANVYEIDPSLSVVSNGCKLYNNNTEIKSISFAEGKCQFTDIMFTNVKDNSLIVKVLLDNSSELSSSSFVINTIDKPNVSFEPPSFLVKGVTTNLTSNVVKVSGGATFNSCMVKVNSYNYAPAIFNVSSETCSYDITPMLAVGDDETVAFRFISNKSGEVDSPEKKIRVVSKPVVKLNVNSPYVFEDKTQDITAVVTDASGKVVSLDSGMNLLSCKLLETKVGLSIEGVIKGSSCSFSSVSLGADSYNLFAELVLSGDVVLSSNEVKVVSYVKPEVPTRLVNPKVIVKDEATEIEISTPKLEGITYDSCVIKAKGDVVSGAEVSGNSCKVTYTSEGSSGKLSVKAKFISNASGEVGDNELQIDMVDRPTIVIDDVLSPIFYGRRDITATLGKIDPKITARKCELVSRNDVLSIGVVASEKCKFSRVNLKLGSYNVLAKLYVVDDNSNEAAIIETSPETVLVIPPPLVAFDPPANLIDGKATEIKASVEVGSGVEINSCAIKIDTAEYISATLSGSAPNYECKYSRTPVASVGSSENFKFKFISTVSGDIESGLVSIPVGDVVIITIGDIVTPIFDNKSQTIIANITGLIESVTATTCELKNGNTLIKTGVIKNNTCEFSDVILVANNYNMKAHLTLNGGVVAESAVKTIASVVTPTVLFTNPPALIRAIKNDLIASATVPSGVVFTKCQIKIATASYVDANLKDGSSCDYEYSTTAAVGTSEVITFKFVSDAGEVSSSAKSLKIVATPKIEILPGFASTMFAGSYRQSVTAAIKDLSSEFTVSGCSFYNPISASSVTGKIQNNTECLFSSVGSNSVNIYRLVLRFELNTGIVIEQDGLLNLNVVKAPKVTPVVVPIINGVPTELKADVAAIPDVTYKGCEIKIGTDAYVSATLNDLKCSYSYTGAASTGNVSVQFKYTSQSGIAESTATNYQLIAKPTVTFTTIPASTLFIDKEVDIVVTAANITGLTIAECKLQKGATEVTATNITGGVCAFAGQAFSTAGTTAIVGTVTFDNGAKVSTTKLDVASVVKPSVTFTAPAALISGTSTELTSSVVMPSGITVNSCSIKVGTGSYANATLSGSAPNYECKNSRTPVAAVGTSEVITFKFTSTDSGEVESPQKEINVIESSSSTIELDQFMSPIFSNKEQQLSATINGVSESISVTNCKLKGVGNDIDGVVIGKVCQFPLKTFVVGNHDLFAEAQLSSGESLTSTTVSLKVVDTPEVNVIKVNSLISGVEVVLKATVEKQTDVTIDSCEWRSSGGSWILGDIDGSDVSNYVCSASVTPTAIVGSNEELQFRFISNVSGVTESEIVSIPVISPSTDFPESATAEFTRFTDVTFDDNSVTLDSEIKDIPVGVVVDSCLLKNGETQIAEGVLTDRVCSYRYQKFVNGTYNLVSEFILSDGNIIKTEARSLKSVAKPAVVSSIAPIMNKVATKINVNVNNVDGINYDSCKIKIGDGLYTGANLKGLECSTNYTGSASSGNLSVMFKYQSRSGYVESSVIKYPQVDKPTVQIVSPIALITGVDTEVTSSVVMPLDVSAKSCYIKLGTGSYVEAVLSGTAPNYQCKNIIKPQASVGSNDTIKFKFVSLASGEIESSEESIPVISKPIVIFTEKSLYVFEDKAQNISVNVQGLDSKLRVSSCKLKDGTSEVADGSVFGSECRIYSVKLTPNRHDLSVELSLNNGAKITSNEIQVVSYAKPEIPTKLVKPKTIIKDKVTEIEISTPTFTGITYYKCEIRISNEVVTGAKISDNSSCKVNYTSVGSSGILPVEAIFTSEESGEVGRNNELKINMAEVSSPYVDINSFISPVFLGKSQNIKATVNDMGAERSISKCILKHADGSLASSSVLSNICTFDDSSLPVGAYDLVAEVTLDDDSILISDPAKLLIYNKPAISFTPPESAVGGEIYKLKATIAPLKGVTYDECRLVVNDEIVYGLLFANDSCTIDYSPLGVVGAKDSIKIGYGSTAGYVESISYNIPIVVAPPKAEFRPFTNVTFDDNRLIIDSDIIGLPSDVRVTSCALTNKEIEIKKGTISGTSCRYSHQTFENGSYMLVSEFTLSDGRVIKTKPKALNSIEKPVLTPVVKPIMDRIKSKIIANIADISDIVYNRCEIKIGSAYYERATLNGLECSTSYTGTSSSGNLPIIFKYISGSGSVESDIVEYPQVGKPLVVFAPPVALISDVGTELISSVRAPKDIVIDSCSIKVGTRSYAMATLSGGSPNYQCKDLTKPQASVGSAETVIFKFTSIESGEIEGYGTEILVVSKPLIDTGGSSLYVFEDKVQNISSNISSLDSILRVLSCKLKDGTTNIAEGTFGESKCNFTLVTLPPKDYNLYVEVELSNGANVTSIERPVVSYAKPEVATTLVKPEVIVKGQVTEIEISTPSFTGITYNTCEIKVNNTVVAGSNLSGNSCKVNYTSQGSSGKLPVKAKFVSNASGEIGDDNELEIDMVELSKRK